MSGGVALVLLGDVMLGRVVDEALTVLRPAQHMHRVWGDCLPLLRGGMAATGEQQLVAGNLECAVTDAEEKEEKEFNFKLSPANVDALTTARFDFASLANNHSLDYKEQGLHETRRVLAAAGIAAAGAGTAGEAAAPALVERGGCKLAFFCYSDHYETWAATERRPGINYIRPETATPEAVAAQLAAAQAAGADLTVVFVHWGPNWRWRPSKAIQRLARTFVDCGASIVFGHSSHHIKGIEVYRGCPIIYGAGGFIDDYKLDENYRNDLGFLYRCHIGAVGSTSVSADHVGGAGAGRSAGGAGAGEGPSGSGGKPAAGALQPTYLELVPTRIVHMWTAAGRPRYVSEVHIAHGADARWLRTRLREVSAEWGTPLLDGGAGRLIIPLQGGGSSGSGEEAHDRRAGDGEAGAPAGSGSGMRSMLHRLLSVVVGL